MNEVKEIKFQIEGEWLTDFIRNLYYADKHSYEDCKKRLINSLRLQDATETEKTELFDSILYGKKKFTGINELQLVDDIDFDVYSYSRFSRPSFKDNKVMGFLLKDGVFVECTYKGHNSTLEWIGEENAEGAVIFGYSTLEKSTYCYTDRESDILTKQQLKWIDKHANLFSELQSFNIEKIKKRENI